MDFDSGLRAHAVPDILPATPADAERLIATLTLAFAADPLNRWLFPDGSQYLRYFPVFVRAFAGAAFNLGSAWRDAYFSGCALWLPPGHGPDEAAITELIEDGVPAQRRGEITAVFAAMGEIHPDTPHWYLPLIGVDAMMQGRGLGTALLRQVTDQCDREQLPAYLEATSPRNVRLYLSHGFRPLAPLRIGSCPPITPMWRDPV
ncbi:MAG: GNAT family N-acetyltransferase [Porticoccaceae bacterium]